MTSDKNAIKDDDGKLEILKCPTQIIKDITEVRMYGYKKYGEQANHWDNVEINRYINALLRHTLEFMKDRGEVDSESGIQHYKHMACNMAFICEMMEGKAGIDYCWGEKREPHEEENIMKLFCKHESILEHIEDVYGDKINTLPRYTRSVWQCPDCGKILYKNYLSKYFVKVPDKGIGELSDGYHTFNELYHHRAILFSVICNSHKELAWKSKKHDTGDMYDGMFIVGIETPAGQATYHYDIKPYWDMFHVIELEKAPKWDGHSPTDAITRISKLN